MYGGQGVKKRCHLSWLTNSPLVDEPQCGEGSCVFSANEYSCAHGAQINFGDLTPYLTYDGGPLWSPHHKVKSLIRMLGQDSNWGLTLRQSSVLTIYLRCSTTWLRQPLSWQRHALILTTPHPHLTTPHLQLSYATSAIGYVKSTTYLRHIPTWLRQISTASGYDHPQLHNSLHHTHSLSTPHPT